MPELGQGELGGAPSSLLPQWRGPFPSADIWTGHLEAWWVVAGCVRMCVRSHTYVGVFKGWESVAGSFFVREVPLLRECVCDIEHLRAANWNPVCVFCVNLHPLSHQSSNHNNTTGGVPESTAVHMCVPAVFVLQSILWILSFLWFCTNDDKLITARIQQYIVWLSKKTFFLLSNWTRIAE